MLDPAPATLAVSLLAAFAVGCGGSPGPEVAAAARASPTVAEYGARFPLSRAPWKGVGEGTPTRRALVLRERELLERLRLASDPELHRDLGQLYTMAGEPERGAAHLVAALRGDQGDVEAWMWLGANRLEEGELHEALRLLARAAELDATNAHVETYRGVAWMRLGDEARARAAFERAVELDPANADARTPLGELCEDAGELELAFEHLLAAHTARPDWAPTLFRLARVADELGRSQEAAHYARLHERVTILDDLALLYDTIPEAQRRAQLGIHFLESGRAGAALPEFEAALELDPAPNVEVNALLGRAWCLVELGRVDEARAATAALGRAYPSHPELEVLASRSGTDEEGGP